MKKLLLLCLIVGMIHIAFATDNLSFTQTYFDKWARQNGIVGAALAVNDKIYFYGYRDRNLSLPVNEQTQFGIGSITKTFISVILLKLEAEGKLSIHDPITKYLPQYKKLKNTTIKAMMQMTAGFNDVADDSLSPLQQIEMAYRKFNSDLSERWSYSNVSYQLLGILIEKVTHQSLNQILSEKITVPLHLSSIYIPNKSQAASFREYQNGKVKISNFKNAYAAGGLVSNLSDLRLFIRHLFIIKDLLPAEQYKELTTFIDTSQKYYAFTGAKPPKFGLGVFKWNIPPHGDVLMYAGVLGEGFTSAYTVIGKNVLIAQSNTYNHNDFTLLWPHRNFTKGIIKNMLEKNQKICRFNQVQNPN